MVLYDFLARSLDLLALIEAIEQHQAAMAADMGQLDVAPAGDASCGALLERLRERHRLANADLDRAIELLADFQ